MTERTCDVPGTADHGGTVPRLDGTPAIRCESCGGLRFFAAADGAACVDCRGAVPAGASTFIAKPRGGRLRFVAETADGPIVENRSDLSPQAIEHLIQWAESARVAWAREDRPCRVDHPLPAVAVGDRIEGDWATFRGPVGPGATITEIFRDGRGRWMANLRDERGRKCHGVDLT